MFFRIFLIFSFSFVGFIFPLKLSLVVEQALRIAWVCQKHTTSLGVLGEALLVSE
jgi:hypothetical protein